MVFASLPSDSVPTSTFTPQEPLVELLRVSLSKDAVLVMAAPQVTIFLSSCPALLVICNETKQDTRKVRVKVKVWKFGYYFQVSSYFG
jgi:hypothetical protein